MRREITNPYIPWNPTVKPAKDDESAKIDKIMDFSKIPITMKNDIRKLDVSSKAPVIISAASFCILTIKPALHIVSFTDLD